MDQNERRETAGDHVISTYFSWTCPVDQNESRETAEDHVISTFLVDDVSSGDQNEARNCRGSVI